MAPVPTTPRRSTPARSRNRPSLPRTSSTRLVRPNLVRPKLANGRAASEPPRKKTRYIPGGPGGGGRYVYEDGTEVPVGGTGPGGYNYIGDRGRVGRQNKEAGVTPVVYHRRDRPSRSTRTVPPRSQQPAMRFTSAAQAAAAVVQSDGYKPREERGWEEFHPNLDIEAELTAYTIEEVDGTAPTRPSTPVGTSTPGSVNGAHIPASASNTDPVKTTNGDVTPVAPAVDLLQQFMPGSPFYKKRPGRPPKDPAKFYAAKLAAEGKVGAAAFHGLAYLSQTPKPAPPPLQNQNAKERLTLPQPSYRRTNTLDRFEDGYIDKSMANVGYQESDIYIRPERTLIRLTDGAIEEDLDLGPGYKSDGETNVAIGSGGVGRVEYDMDEQDAKWLHEYNLERKANGVDDITTQIFEITITKIEKEWHALEKRIPKPNPKPPQTHRPRSSSAAAVNGEPQAGEEQDSKCAICDDGDCENTNAIVFCDGCDLAVHQECYGVPFIPEGQWLCRKCQLIGRGVPTCIFCPNTDGAFKQTNSSKWAHLLCAMWIPEVSLGNYTFMEPVMEVEKVPKTRWKLTCYLCNQKMGACIQCGNKSCYQAFHVTCARRARLFLKMKNAHGTLSVLDQNCVLKAFCDKHCPADYAKENDVAHAARDARNFYKRSMRGRIWADSQQSAVAMAATHRHTASDNHGGEHHHTGQRISLTLGDIKKKDKEPPKHMWKLPSGAPIIPAVVYDSVANSLQRFTIRKRREFASDACKYWTLKREARRGAALLKRLQLQMENFSSMEITRRNFAGMGPAGRTRLMRRLEFSQTLLEDMEKLKQIADTIKEREAIKLRAVELEEHTVDTIYFPIIQLVAPIIEKALSVETKTFFTKGLENIKKQVEARFYISALDFATDLCIVVRKGIESAPAIQSAQEEGIRDLDSLAKQDKLDIKERQKFARKIIKAVRPQLQAAVQAEADITNKSGEILLKELESLFESSLETRPESTNGAIVDHLLVQTNANGFGVDGTNEVVMDEANADPVTAEGDATGAEAVAEQAENADAAAPENMELERDDGNTNGVKATEDPDQIKPATVNNDGTTPPDTNGYVSEPSSHPQPAPPTPPLSNSDPSASGPSNSTATQETDNILRGGGVPWYLDRFKPEGTTVGEEQWSGREIVRSMSEELSEIDDEELRGLMDSDAMMDLDGDVSMGVGVEGGASAVAAPASAAPAPKMTKKGKKKKAWKGFK